MLKFRHYGYEQFWNTAYTTFNSTSGRFVQPTRNIEIINGENRHVTNLRTAVRLDGLNAIFKVNKIHYISDTYVFNTAGSRQNIEESRQFTSILRGVQELPDKNNENEDLINFIKIYTDDVTDVERALKDYLVTNGHLIEPISDTTQYLYTKCMNQVELREMIPYPITIKVLKHLTKNILIIITNYVDNEQASDTFLTIGLLPVLFPAFKERFTVEELDFLKVLVNRSQVKRIANQKATDTFEELMQTIKYIKALNELTLSNSINTILARRRYTVDTQINMLQQQAANKLRDYEHIHAHYFQKLKEKERLENSVEDLKEEYLQALNTEGIVGCEIDGNERNRLTLYIRVPLEFYETDELECMLRNYNENSFAYKLFKNLFLSGKYKLMIVTRFSYLLDSTNNDGERELILNRFQLNTDDFLNYNALYNPHLHHFHCLGNYEPELRKAHAEENIVMFVNLAIASSKSINFRDNPVIERFRSFIEDIKTTTLGQYMRCVEDEEGNKYTLQDIVNEYDREQAENAEEVELHDTVVAETTTDEEDL